MLLPGGRSVVVHQHHLVLYDLPRQLHGIGDGGRTADKLGVGSVESAYTFEPSYHVSQVAPEYSAIVMYLVDHHKLQVFEKFDPSGVVGQNSGVKHVRIGHHDMSRGADGGPCRARGISIKRVGPYVSVQVGHKLVKLRHLILR